MSVLIGFLAVLICLCLHMVCVCVNTWGRSADSDATVHGGMRGRVGVVLARASNRPPKESGADKTAWVLTLHETELPVHTLPHPPVHTLPHPPFFIADVRAGNGGALGREAEEAFSPDSPLPSSETCV